MKKNKIIIISMLLMGLALFVNMDEAAADASVIYVNATGGNDNWNGQSQFYVNGTTGPKKTINSGTTAVLANGTVNIADGTYSGTGNWGITLTKNMTIQGQSQNNTIIDGSGSRQIFVINSGVNVTMINLTIQNARPTNTNGGAISNNGGTLTVNNCKFSGNSVTREGWFQNDPIYGGAIYSTGNLNIENSHFINNVATTSRSTNAQGGAIHSTGAINIVNSTFINNTALGSGGSNLVVGGAISAQNNIRISGSNFINNSAGTGATEGFGGGALYIGSSTLTVSRVNITESSFINNTAGYGGAIWMNAGSSANPSTITQSTFHGNSAYYGGAIRNWGFLNIIGSDFVSNRASEGAAINNYQGTLNINFNRILGNTGSVEIFRNAGTINATNNWWGSNTSPVNKVSAQVNVSTWLVLNINAVPNPTHTGYTSTITADLTRNQNGVYFNPANGHVPNGIPVQFTATLGSIPSSSTLVSGSTSRIFTAGTTPGVATVSATVDGVQVNTSINLNPVAALQISQKVNTPVNVGDRVTFQVSVVNNGPNTATNIQIRDIVPVELTNVVVTPSVGNYNMATGIWTINSLNNGSTATLTISGDATIPMAGKTINNTATQISQNEYTPQLPTSTQGVYTKMADVQLSQTGNSPVNVGDTVTYVVTARNIGPDNATNFIIENKIPAGLLNVVVTPSTGSYLNGNWTVPFLANGDFATLTITGISSVDMAGKNTTNTATKIFETEYDPTTIGESVSYDVYTKKANVVLSQTGNYVKDVVTFLVTATNNGPDAATNINIKNLVPAGLSNVLVTPNLGTYDISTGIWNIPVLANGAFAVLNITGKAVPQSTVNNAATFINQTEFNQHSQNMINSNVYVAAVDIAVTQYSWYPSTYSYSCGNTPVFVVDVRNSNSYDDATGVEVEYIIGKGFEFIDMNTRGVGYAVYDDVSRTVTWFIDYMPRGSMAFMNVYLRVIETGNHTENLKTTAKLLKVDQYDTLDDNNIQDRTIFVPVSSDVGVDQSMETFEIEGKKYVTYVVLVSNNGPDNATGVRVTDKLPSGLVYVSHSSSNDGGSTWIDNDSAYNPVTGVWNIGSFVFGDPTKIIRITAEIIGNDTIKNTVTKTQNEADWNRNNNGKTLILDLTGTYETQSDVSVTQYSWYPSTYSYSCGNTPVFVVDVRNSNSYDDATGVKVQYMIGTGYEFINMNTRGVGYAVYDDVSRTVTWFIDYMPRGSMAFMNVYLRVIETGNHTENLKTTAQLLQTEEPKNNGNEKQDRTIFVPVSSDVGVDQSMETFEIEGKKYVTYVVLVSNNGPDNATGVRVTDKLPSGLVYVSHSSSNDGGSTWIDNDSAYNPVTGVWNIGSFVFGDPTKIIRITAEIIGNDTIKNTVTKTQNEADWNRNNNGKTKILVN